MTVCRMENTAVGRVSDDFYPTDAASWTSHLGICAYNSLFMAPLVQVHTFCFAQNMQPCLYGACCNATVICIGCNVGALWCMTAFIQCACTRVSASLS